jgi:hypothetical protein
VNANQWNVYLNGKWIDKVGGTKDDLKAWVKRNLTSTHIGQWRRISGGHEYSTTIGRYYTFKMEIT